MPAPATSKRVFAPPARRLGATLMGLGAVLALALLVARAAPLASRAPPPPPAVPRGALLPVGTLAPAFSVQRLEGGDVTLSALRGRVVLLDFWATWCPPCRAELPWLVPLARRYESKGLAMVAISQDRPDMQRAEVSRFAAELPGLSRYAALGGYEVGEAYGAESLPTLYLIDRSGRVVDVRVGMASEREVVAAVERALATAE